MTRTDVQAPARLEVLVCAATARDNAMTMSLFKRAGIAAVDCRNVAGMSEALTQGAGALLLGEECLADADVSELFVQLSRQEAWSDLPLILLARPGADSLAVIDALSLGFNTTVLERPMRVASLLSATRSALRARRRQYEIRDLLADLRHADQRKTDFLATLAHELRNPLAPIRSCVGILRRFPADPQPVIEVIDRQVHHMVRLVDDLMEVSRINRGKVELRLERVELSTVIRSACETSQPRIDAGRHTLAVHLPPEPIWLEGDPVRLAQVFSNLLNNAARYTAEGGAIAVDAAVVGDEAVVRVSDNGMGISPELLPDIFEMFSQGDSRTVRAQSGLGIGLALVRSLVEMHGGTVAAHSDGVGRGSRFEVRLPLAWGDK